MSSTQIFEFGVLAFGELESTSSANPQTRLREIIDLAKVVDQASIDVFGMGERHRKDFALPYPPVLLAAIAEATE